MQLLQFAYLSNIAPLILIAIPTIFKLFPTDESKFQESEGWRILVGTLWFAILVLSVLGMFDPLRYSPAFS